MPSPAWVTISRWQRDGIRDRELRTGEKGERGDEEQLEQVGGGE